MGFEDLTPEQQEKARACKSKEELAELAETVGVKLSEDELDAIAGGACKKDCTMLGAQCMPVSDCMLKGNCTNLGDCQEFLACPLKSCTNLQAPFECKEAMQ